MNQSVFDANQSPPPVPPQDPPARGTLARLILFLAEIALLAALSAYIMVGAEIVPFHGDESTILYTTHDVSYILGGQLTRILYSATPDAIGPSVKAEQELRLLNGTVARYVYGAAAINPKTRQPYDAINEQWDWGASYGYNLETGHMPTPKALLQARLISSAFLVGAMLCLYGLARRIGGPGAAVIAVLYFTFNPAVLLNGRRAMQESFWLFFGLLGLFIALDTCMRIWGIPRPIWYRRRRSLGRFLPAQMANYFYLGGTLGLALASKHTALFYVVAALGAVIFAPLFAKRRIWLKHIFGVPVMIAALALMFLALNPAWWGNQAERLSTVLSLRSDLLAGQTSAFGGYANVDERIAGLFRQGFIVQPQYYEVSNWRDFIGNQIATYEASPWHGISIGGSGAGALIVIILMIIGVMACVRSLAKNNSAASDSAVSIPPMGAWVALWLGLAGLGSALTTPLEWQRYYLPLYPAIAVFLGVGVISIVRGLTTWRATSIVNQPPQDAPLFSQK